MELGGTHPQAMAQAAVGIRFVEAGLDLLGLADLAVVISTMLVVVVTDVLRLRWGTFMLAIRSYRSPAELER